jgi:c(7)-type cytochrome triheme protein
MTATSLRPAALAGMACLALGLAGAALADLPRLPGDLNLRRGVDSPGQVVFRHSSHVDADKPDCVTCHPRRFSILGSQGTPRAAITHQAMEQKQACGGCHGQQAFGFEDCSNCHSG